MKTRIRKIESQTSAQQDQINELIKSLPKEVRKERQQQIDSLQKAMSKSMRTIRDTPGAGSGAGSFAGSVTRSRASTTTSSQQLQPQLRGNPTPQNANSRPAFQQSPPDGYFAPASRRSSQASQQSSTRQRQQTPSAQKQQDQARLRDRRQSNSNELRGRAVQESPLASEIDASRTAPGAAFQRPQTQMEVTFRQLPGSQSARSLGRSESARSLASSQSARSLARSESNRSLRSARMAGSQSARNLPSERMGLARDDGRPRSARGSAASSYSDFSGCSTPIAGRTWGHLTRSFGNGIGTRVFPDKKDNLIVGDFFQGMNDNFERSYEDEMNSGIERCIGHGKKMMAKCPSQASHLHGAVPIAAMAFDKSSFTGETGDLIQAQEGLDANIGHGIKKFSRSTHGRHHISDDTESEPGLHGHHKHEDYKDGMWYCIGHGKRRVAPGHMKDTRQIPAAPSPGSPKVNRVAGLSSRDTTRSGTSFDPSRKGTHLDKQKERESVVDRRVWCPFAERMM